MDRIGLDVSCEHPDWILVGPDSVRQQYRTSSATLSVDL